MLKGVAKTNLVTLSIGNKSKLPDSSLVHPLSFPIEKMAHFFFKVESATGQSPGMSVKLLSFKLAYTLPKGNVYYNNHLCTILKCSELVKAL